MNIIRIKYMIIFRMNIWSYLDQEYLVVFILNIMLTKHKLTILIFFFHYYI